MHFIAIYLIVVEKSGVDRVRVVRGGRDGGVGEMVVKHVTVFVGRI